MIKFSVHKLKCIKEVESLKEIFVLGPSSSYALWDLRTPLIHQGLELDVRLVELVVRWRCRVSVVMGHTIGNYIL